MFSIVIEVSAIFVATTIFPSFVNEIITNLTLIDWSRFEDFHLAIGWEISVTRQTINGVTDLLF